MSHAFTPPFYKWQGQKSKGPPQDFTLWIATFTRYLIYCTNGPKVCSNPPALDTLSLSVLTRRCGAEIRVPHVPWCASLQQRSVPVCTALCRKCGNTQQRHLVEELSWFKLSVCTCMCVCAP